MIKKTNFLIVLLTFISGVILFDSCRKDKTDFIDLALLNLEQSNDAEDFNLASEEIDDEIESIVAETSLKSASYSIPCNATIDSSLILNKKMTITFDGVNCKGNRNRSGIVTVELTEGSRWQDEGAKITVTFENLKITNLSTERYLVLNGTKIHTNVSGGLLINLGQANTPETIVRMIESNDMKVTFTNGTQRKWNIARMRSFTKSDNNIIITVNGFGETAGHTNLVEWGTNRRGTQFFTEITTPVVYSEACDYYPSKGVKTHFVGNREIEVTLGTDVTGTPVEEGCADYYKVVWTGADDVLRTEIVHY